MLFKSHDPPLRMTISGLWMLGETLGITALPAQHEVDLMNRGLVDECNWSQTLRVIASRCEARVQQCAQALGLEVTLTADHSHNPVPFEPGTYGWHYDNLGPEIVEAVCVVGEKGAAGTAFGSPSSYGSREAQDIYQGAAGELYLMAGCLHSQPLDGYKYQRLLLRWYFPEFVTAKWMRERLQAQC